MPDSKAYHCICSTLILATNHDLDKLPVRQGSAQDQAKILPLQSQQTDVILQNVHFDAEKVIIRREDGFEKRTLMRCARCKLPVGYQLDQSHFTDGETKAKDIAYILPGSLMSTHMMVEGGMPSPPSWALK